MAKAKFDGVVEVVHYTPAGSVDWVRAYLRRGAVFTDRVLLDRQALIEELKAGKRYLAGKRIPLMGNNFEVSEPLRVLQADGQDVLVTGDLQSNRDRLESVPVV